jgi:hypothetical protein
MLGASQLEIVHRAMAERFERKPLPHGIGCPVHMARVTTQKCSVARRGVTKSLAWPLTRLFAEAVVLGLMSPWLAATALGRPF